MNHQINVILKIINIMILTEKIKIKISKKNIQHFKNIGMDVKLKDIIDIEPILLNKGSHIVIDVKCDICGSEKKLSFISYKRNIDKLNFYACSSKCAQEKVKNTNIKKFGEEYYSKTKEYRNSVHNTSLNKFQSNLNQLNIQIEELRKEEIEITVRKEIEKLIAKNITEK